MGGSKLVNSVNNFELPISDVMWSHFIHINLYRSKMTKCGNLRLAKRYGIVDILL